MKVELEDGHVIITTDHRITIAAERWANSLSGVNETVILGWVRMLLIPAPDADVWQLIREALAKKDKLREIMRA